MLKQMTVVFRNGASVRVPTVANRPMPYVMQAVRHIRTQKGLGFEARGSFWQEPAAGRRWQAVAGYRVILKSGEEHICTWKSDTILH